jgi:glycerophosphoryl diester phosphodiesterase
MALASCLVIAHRGASAYAPENTLAAFDLALRMGAKHAELDVHETLDGEVAVIHDATLERTTNGKGPVAERTLAELRRLDAGAWFDPAFAGERMPTLAEVLTRYRGRLHLQVEIKGRSDTLPQATVESIRRHGMSASVTVISFAAAQIAKVRGLAPELATGWLVEDVSPAVVARARALGIPLLSLPAAKLTAGLVRRLHAAGFTVLTWGVKSEEKMRAAVQAGVDGMTIDFPDKLLAYLETRPAEGAGNGNAQGTS